MRIEFNKLKKARNMAIELCKTNGEALYSLAGAVDKDVEIMLNGLSELSFKVYKNEQSDLYYDEIIGRKYVKVENIGLFIIKNVTTENDGVAEYKQVDCVSAEFELASKNMGLLEGTYKFYDPSSSDKSLMNIVLSYLPNWKIGQIEDDLWNIYRTFDIKDNNIYNFLMSEVQEAYQCVFIFDTTNRTISAKTTKSIVRPTDIFLSNRNLVKRLSVHEDSEEVKTALNIYGDGDLSIHSANPLGTATLYDFSYYKSLPNMMSKELIAAIDKWETKKAGYEEEYKAILKALKGDNGNTVKLESDLKDLESELNALEDQQAIQVAAGEDLTEIARKIEAKKAEIEAKKKEIAASGSSVEENKKRLKEIAEDLKFPNNFSQELIKELSVFIIQATHQCTNFGVTDEMNENEKLEVIEQLKAYGEEQLKRVSQPTYTFDIDVINFTKLIKYKKFIEQLELGSEVTICVDRETDKFARVLLMGYSMNLDSSKDIQLHFSNKLKFGSDQYTWEELINQSTSVSTTVDFESPSWSKAESANSKIDEYINAALDLTQKEIISSDNQEFTLTRQGLRGREWDDETQSYLPEQLWMTKNVLAFSDNGFTGRPRMALGKTLLPDGTYGYGIIAEQLVGNIMLTKKLVVENENHSFKVDGDSILIKNANIIMNNDGTSNEDKTLEDLLEQAMSSGGNVIYRQPEPPTNAKENDLWFDTDDNNKPYVFKDGEWVSVRDTSSDDLYDKVSSDISVAIEDVYSSMEDMKQAIEDGEITIFYQPEKPAIPPAKEGDLWYDTSLVNGVKKNEAWIMKNGVWNKIKDSDVTNALNRADQAQITADGKIKTYWQTKAPVGLTEKDLGDLWFDTDDKNKLYRWNGSEWIDVQDKSINDIYDKVSGDLSIAIGQVYEDMGDLEQAIKDGEITIFYQNTKPLIPPAGEGDLWYDTTEINGVKKNEAWIVNDGVWKTIKDGDITNALDKADQAQITADGKIKTYWQPEPPTGLQEKDLGDLWFDTNDGNKLYRWSGSKWVDVQDKTINDVYDEISGNLSLAIGRVYDDMEDMKQAIEDGEITIFYQDSKPSIPPAKEGDLWYDTTMVNGKKKNEAWIVDNGVWNKIKDSDITNALDQAGQAQITADGKIKTYWQPENPVGLTIKDLGDLWFDTDNNNKLYRWSGNEWVDVQDKTFAKAYDEISNELSGAIGQVYEDMNNMKQAIEDGEVTIFYQSNKPTIPPAKEGDLWYDTTLVNGVKKNEAWIVNEGVWKNIKDSDVVDALDKANTAQITADGKIKTYWQTNQPTGLIEKDLGDLWFDIDDNNKLYRWNGREWIDVQDKTFKQVAQDFASSIESINNKIGDISASIEDGVIETYYQPTDPMLDSDKSPKIGDLWFDTKNGKLYRHNGGKNSLSLEAKRMVKEDSETSTLQTRPIVGIFEQRPVVIQKGETYSLPNRINVSLPENIGVFLDVIWDDSYVDTDIEATYLVYGEVVVKDDVINPNNIKAKVKIIVGSGTIKMITTVGQISDIKIQQGGDYPLPGQVACDMSNDITRYVDVKWNRETVNVNIPNTYIAYGVLRTKEDEINPLNLRPQRKITVLGDGSPSVPNVTGIEPISDIKINIGGSYNLPSKVLVHFSDKSSKYLYVSWNTSSVNVNVANTYIVKGRIQLESNMSNTSNIEASARIIVSGGGSGGGSGGVTILSAEVLSDNRIEVGGSYSLPSKVIANLSNGGAKYLNVNWDDNHVDTRVEKTYIVYGDFVLDGTVTNPKNIRPTRKIIVGSGGSGTTDKIIVGYDAIQDITINKGERYTLPERVAVNLEPTGRLWMDVVWSDSHVNTNSPNTYTVYGEFQIIDDNIINPQRIQPKVRIIVKDTVSPPNPSQITVTGVEQLSDIRIQQGGSFPLPSKILVSLSNSTSKYMNVTWHRESVNVNIPNTYIVYGDIQLDAGVTNPKNIRPSRKITVLGDTSSTPTTITSIEKLSPTTIEKGGSYNLPSQVLVTLSVGGQRYMSVKWKDSHVDVWTPNTYTVYGDITLDEDITNPSGLRAEKQIIVQGTIVEQVNITGVTNPEPIIVQKYGVVTLPKQVQVRLSNSSTRYMNVSWDSRNIDTSQARTYDVYGTIQLEENITNTSSIKAHVQVIVQEEQVQTHNITRVNPIDDIAIAVGGTYKLPTTVSVQLSNQTTKQMKVSWRTGSIDIYTPKTYPVEGDIVLEGNITNTQGLKARVNVIVKSSSFTFWDAITDKGIIEAIDQARNAQTTADGKISSYYTPTKPTTNTHPNLSEGDIWIDTDDGNRQYRYTNGQWTDIHDKLIDKVSSDLANSITGVYDSMEELKQAIGDGEIVVYYQPNSPGNPKEGDLWYDTDDKNKAYIYKNNRWNSIQDGNIIDALDKAGQAQATADGKIKTYWQPTQPSPMKPTDVGDLWIDTDDKNKLYRYNGSTWVSVRDGSIDEAVDKVEGVIDKVDSVIDSNGNLDASKMKGEILAGKTNILCANSATGRVLALNENGIIVGTANSSGTISEEGTFITKDGINASRITSGSINAININGSNITGSNIKGSEIIAGDEYSFHTILNDRVPFGTYYGPSSTPAVEVYASDSTNTGWSYLLLYDENGDAVFRILGARTAGKHETMLNYMRATTLTISAHNGYYKKELVSSGKKQAIVPTEHYGYRELYCEESTKVYFTDSDISETKEYTKDGETYYAISIAINPVFLETIEPNSVCRYIISVTPYSDARVWVNGVHDKYINIRSDKPTEFSYEIKGVRKGYKDNYINERSNIFREMASKE